MTQPHICPKCGGPMWRVGEETAMSFAGRMGFPEIEWTNSRIATPHGDDVWCRSCVDQAAGFHVSRMARTSEDQRKFTHVLRAMMDRVNSLTNPRGEAGK